MLIEQELVSRLLAGDTKAEEDFYHAMSPRLLRASKYFLGYNDGDSEDVVQETFIIALAKMKDYTFEAPIYAWLRQICIRRCYARLRCRKRLVAQTEQDLELFMRGLAVEKAQKEVNDLLQEDRLKLLRQVKKRLGPESRKIIELKYVKGMSYAEMSLYLKVPLGTVMSRLARARDQMRFLAEESELEELSA